MKSCMNANLLCSCLCISLCSLFFFKMKWLCVFQVVVVLQQVFALIQTVLSKWLNDSQVVEVGHGQPRQLVRKVTAQIIRYDGLSWSHVLPQAVCAIFEKSVKTLLHEFAPMVSQLSEMLGQMYSTIPQASALDLTRQVHSHSSHIAGQFIIFQFQLQSAFPQSYKQDNQTTTIMMPHVVACRQVNLWILPDACAVCLHPKTALELISFSFSQCVCFHRLQGHCIPIPSQLRWSRALHSV